MRFFRNLIALFKEGGLEICTPAQKGMLRTVLQPDADMIMWVPTAALNDPQALAQHLKDIQAKMASIIRFGRVLQHWWLPIPLPLFFHERWSLMGDTLYQKIRVLLETWVLPVLLWGLLLWLIRTFIVWLVQRYIQRQLNS